MDKYLTVREVAELLQMTEDWVWRQCKERKIPHHRIGKRFYRFTQSDLEAISAQFERPVVTPETHLPIPSRAQRPRA